MWTRPSFFAALLIWSAGFASALLPRIHNTQDITRLHQNDSDGVPPIVQASLQTLRSFKERLEPPVIFPWEYVELESAVNDHAPPETLAQLIYMLMCEVAIRYDESPDGKVLTPTVYDLKRDKNVPEVKERLQRVYRYGLSMLLNGGIGEEDLKTFVLDRLGGAVGLGIDGLNKYLEA